MQASQFVVAIDWPASQSQAFDLHQSIVGAVIRYFEETICDFGIKELVDHCAYLHLDG
nr:hypothetical protein [uncultured Noviherbaspirillum sp.]